MIARLVRLGLWAIALVSIAAYAVLSWKRFLCPIELGNGEGMMFDNALRVARGQPLYVEPTLHFIPFVYMPLYATLVAPLIRIFGPALWEGRLIDQLGNLAVVATTFFVIRRETRSALLGATGAAFYLMGHGITRGGYDVVRPDPLMIAIVLVGLAVLRFTNTARGAMVAGAICGLGFFAKQHALLFTATACGYLLFHQRRRLVPFAAAALAVGGGGFLVLSLWLGPWFPFYVLDVPSHWSQLSRGRILTYLGEMLVGKLGALTLPVAVAMAMPPEEERGGEWLWYWTALGGVGTGLLATLDPYAYFHVLMPTIASLAVAAPIALERIGRRLEASRGAAATPLATTGAHAGPPPLTTCLVLALGFLPLLYPMHTLLPRPGAAAARRDIVEKLRSIPGPVLVPFHGFYGTLAGKDMGMTVLPLDDILRSKGNRLLKRDPHWFDRMFDSLRTGPDRPTIVSDTVFSKCGDASVQLWSTLEGPYRRTGDLGDLIERLRPLAGSRNAPTWIYSPVPAESIAAAAPAAATGRSR